jgi:hypothetical protein
MRVILPRRANLVAQPRRIDHGNVDSMTGIEYGRH